MWNQLQLKTGKGSFPCRESVREDEIKRVTGRKGSKKLFKNPVDNEPLPYEILPAGHPSIPPEVCAGRRAKGA